MTENNQLEKQEIKRPWQGTVYSIVLGIISFFMIWSVLVFLDDEGFNVFFEANIFDAVFKLIVLFLLIPMFIVGFWKGWKWVIIMAVVFYSLNVSVDLLNGLMGRDNFVEVISGGFVLYLSIACLKHPFYNQKKVEQKS